MNNDYNGTERANEFGLEVDYQPALVQARVLPAPTVILLPCVMCLLCSMHFFIIPCCIFISVAEVPRCWI
jgi:hypothetical protein